MSLHKKVRKFRTENGKTFPKTSDKMEITKNAEFTKIIAEALCDDFGKNRVTAKTLMQITGAGERTVKNWLEGKNAPRGTHLIDLMRHSDGVLEASLLMAGRHEILAIDKFINARSMLVKMIDIIDELLPPDVE